MFEYVLGDEQLNILHNLLVQECYGLLDKSIILILIENILLITTSIQERARVTQELELLCAQLLPVGILIQQRIPLKGVSWLIIVLLYELSTSQLVPRGRLYQFREAFLGRRSLIFERQLLVVIPLRRELQLLLHDGVLLQLHLVLSFPLKCLNTISFYIILLGTHQWGESRR